MTISSVAGSERTLSIRYIPLLTWGFCAAAATGVGAVLVAMVEGRQPIDAGSVGALLLLLGFAVFIFASGGQYVVATFDRDKDALQIARYGIRGRSITSRILSDVVGLDVRVLRRSQHRLELRMRSGERLALTPYYVVAFSSRGIERLAALLGIEPNLVTPPRA